MMSSKDPGSPHTTISELETKLDAKREGSPADAQKRNLSSSISITVPDGPIRFSNVFGSRSMSG
jgi:hypothetical protein